MAERIYLNDWNGGKRSTNRKHKGKIFNQIRTFTENGIAYLEVKLQREHVMFCDIKDFELLRSQIWYADKHKNQNTYYCKSRKK
jgi:hypothetical protein